MGRRKSSPKFISARVWAGDGQAQEFAEIHFGTGLGRRWAGARVRRNSFRHGSGQAMGRRKSSPKFISARVWTGDGQAQEFAEIHFGMGLGRRWETEMNFGQRAGRRGRRRRWAGARVRRNSFRHGSAQAMGRRKSSPKFISARVWAGDGQPQEFADIHFGTGLGRRWATEMNVGQRAGRRGLAQAMGERNECRSTGRAPGSGQAMGDRNECRSTGRAPGSGQAMGNRNECRSTAGRRGLGRRWARRNEVRSNRQGGTGSGQAMGEAQ
jgi:hypothetical protein